MSGHLVYNGSHLVKLGSHLSANPDCCCGTTCCPAANGLTLYLTISALTLDGGETCDDDCLPSITAAASLGTWNESTLTWLADEGNPGSAVLAALTCVDGQIYFATDSLIVHDGGGGNVCEITTDPDAQALTGLTCDPFYWEGDITVSVNDAGESPCGTGTIHVVISE